MDLVVRAFPVLSGKAAEMRQFAGELPTTRASEAQLVFQMHGGDGGAQAS